ncbi:HAMP domain-containing sensor histidine kinase [Amycolatopsis cynarae]|uniref:histidine kinase n=1 Tax=Amycolatopsis cynarae TaxID=2995223 RepID=A0ABY7ATS0_9PSEU|nr:HAMP domain-containing sensor histidine kinase [Amycolatopsis sp. HUAS 11-8]WAL63345.1 HAMP domain-containing sensor histidine kinase [Amycolatopsis sp. HUAS 11-8]
MRTRVLTVLLAFVVLATASFTFPLLAVTATERTQQLLLARGSDLERFAVLTDQAVTTGEPGTLAAEIRRYTELYGEPVVVVTARRVPMVETGEMSVSDPAVASLVDVVLRNQPGPAAGVVRPWSSAPVLLARPAGTGTRVSGAVVMRASVHAAAADVARTWMLVLTGAALVALACVALALVATRWLLGPMRRLDRAVGRLTAGLPPEHPALAGPPELRKLIAGFNRMSDTVTSALDQQRRLLADTSHQMRNPMTALRLRIDALGPHLPATAQRTYSGAVGELDRIEHLLDDLLTLASAEHRAGELAVGGPGEVSCEVGAVAAAQVHLWEPVAGRAGVELGCAAGPGRAACTEAELAQILDVLLDNAIKYTGPGTRVRVRTRGPVLEVRDDGPGLSGTELSRAQDRFWRAERHRGLPGTGLGLAIAERLVAGRGGRLELEAAAPHGLVVRVTLPSPGAPEGTPA